MISVGLTGGIATGKSTVAGLLRARGIPVVDADQLARDVVAPGTDGLAEVVARFGPGVLTAEGTLDRPALRAIVLDDAAARADLEAITHPRIRLATVEWLTAQSAAGAPVAVVEAALLVETGGYKFYDRVVVVTCAPHRQKQRLMHRNQIPSVEAERWLAAQLPLAQKEAVATDLIRNDGSLLELQQQVERLSFGPGAPSA